MATVVRENIGLLNDKLTVKISKEDYLPSFEKKLKEYSKTANIPGFRKGMVPAGMIKKMYGAGIFNDEVVRTVEAELYKWLNEEKPEIFAQPLPLENDLRSLDMNNPGDVELGFEIGLKPSFELPAFSKASVTNHIVEVTDAMVDEEISRMQIKGGKMNEPESISSDDTVINLLFSEADKEGNTVEGGISKENSALLKYFTPKVQKELQGKKTGDSIVLQLGKAFEGEKLEAILQDLGLASDNKADAQKYFKAEIVKLGLVEKRALEEDFFNEIFPGRGIQTEAELRDALKAEIAQYWESQSRNQLHDQLYHYLLDETKMDFPEAFLKRWMQVSGEKAKSADEAEKEYPGFSNQLKWTLISDKIATDNKLEVGNDELKDYMKADVMRYFGQMNMGGDMSWLDSYIDRMLKDEKQVESAYHRLMAEKVFGFAASQVKAKDKKVTSDELVAMQHNHHH